MKLERELLREIADILNIDTDFTDEEYEGCKEAPFDAVGLTYYLKDAFMKDSDLKVEDIIRLVRVLDAKGIIIEDFPLLEE